MNLIEARFSSVVQYDSPGGCTGWKGRLPKGVHIPCAHSGTRAEDAADCHISGALSVYDEYNMYRMYYAMNAPPKGVVHGIFLVWRMRVPKGGCFPYCKDPGKKGKREEER